MTAEEKKAEQVNQATDTKTVVSGGMATNCMLIRCHTKCWSASRLDKELTAKSKADAQIKGTKNWVRTYKTILDPDVLKAIGQKNGAIHVYVHENTMPWLDSGVRLLPAKSYMRVNKRIRELEEEFLAYRDSEIVANYEELKEAARRDLGPAFKADEYPRISEIRSKFASFISYEPVPTSGDFRVEIQSDELTKIREAVEERQKKASAKAMEDLWKRIYAPVSNVVTQLTKESSKFHGTLVGNIVELVNILPELNWANDQELEAARVRLEKELCAHNTDILKTDTKIRGDVLKAAEQLERIAKAKISEFGAIYKTEFDEVEVTTATPEVQAEVAPVEVMVEKTPEEIEAEAAAKKLAELEDAFGSVM